MTITPEVRAKLRAYAAASPTISSNLALLLLNALDAAEQRAEPLVWRVPTMAEIEAMPHAATYWLQDYAGWWRRPVDASYIKAHARAVIDNAAQIAGPIPEPVEERT